jgi:hypothetical protein
MKFLEKGKIMSNQEHYKAVLDDFLQQRRQHQLKIEEIDSAITVLRRMWPVESGVSVSTAGLASKPDELPYTVTAGKYTGMSVRWAVLNLLSEDTTKPLTTGLIADALEAGGIVSSSKTFAGNVSAVLSGMNHERNEVISTNDGWIISDKGREVWAHIKAKRTANTLHSEPIFPTLQ